MRRTEHSKSGLHIVAIFEAAKGLLVLLTGFGLLMFIHKDVHLAAEQLVRHLHINPARHYPQIFIDAVNHLDDVHLWVLAFSALLYSLVRFVESFGLWKQRQWAEWFALLSAGMYIPVELFAIMHRVTWPKVAVFIVNFGIVVYMAYFLYRSRHSRKHAGY